MYLSHVIFDKNIFHKLKYWKVGMDMEILTDLREEKHLSISKLVILLNDKYEKNYKIYQIINWENGHEQITQKDLEILCDYYEYPIEKLSYS